VARRCRQLPAPSGAFLLTRQARARGKTNETSGTRRARPSRRRSGLPRRGGQRIGLAALVKLPRGLAGGVRHPREGDPRDRFAEDEGPNELLRAPASLAGPGSNGCRNGSGGSGRLRSFAPASHASATRWGRRRVAGAHDALVPQATVVNGRPPIRVLGAWASGPSRHPGFSHASRSGANAAVRPGVEGVGDGLPGRKVRG
jgi:hypothetical protein